MLNTYLETYLNGLGGSLLATDVENIHVLHSLFKQRHELGGALENGTAERVEVATQKAIEIFKKLFGTGSGELRILIYEFQEPSAFGAENQFLHHTLSNCEMEEHITMKGFEIFIYKAPYLNLPFQTILRAIANTEMGFKPSVDQRIYFFDCHNDKAFYMYDDRGCLTNGF
ncbi:MULTISPECIES: hypothetical protein [unclassified Flavobacterium]|uniref:DUF3885 domain-containing protein n=1 Tax=unclassified Flavobacterium TaxID=196869 RepID=UPI001F1321F2|nr:MULTISPECIES: hypothetical protein [unclassified Flavobacterium]UMY64548.1 hypothetical protein MKO97_08490 [Flavobacterium sp. HJ-32-4]